MDAFDFHDELAIEKTRSTSAVIINVLTVLVLLTSLCIGSVFLVIFFNPHVPFNIFPPPTLPALASLPTSTPTPKVVLPPTWTPTIMPSSTITEIPLSTDTPVYIPEETLPSAGETEEAQLTEGFPFIPQDPPGEPIYIPNLHYPDLGCDWMGVAGRAFTLNGAPLKFLTVQVGGVLGGSTLDMLTLTGTALQYGEAGYEFKLADVAIESKHSVWVQLLDQAGLPLSDKIYFDTFADCQKNLALINFQQIR